MCTFKSSIHRIFFLLTMLAAGSLSAQQSEPAVDGNKLVEDIYLAAATVQVSTDAGGDVVVAGSSISVANTVTQDVLAAGGTVNITANVGDDIRAAGGSVAIIGDVGDDLIAAGGTVVLDSASTVGGRAWLAGGTVTVAGNINHDLKAAGKNIILAGQITGDVDLQAENIEIKPGAVIKGDLTYSAPTEADIDNNAVIEGEVTHEAIRFEHFDDDGAGFIGNLMFHLSLAASAIALFLIFPIRSIAVVTRLLESPAKAAGLGIAILFTTPFITLMLLVSVIGVPIGLVVLGLYCITLVVGLLIGVICIGDIGFRQLGKEPDESKRARAWSIAAGAAALLIVDFIPFIGGLAFFIVLIVGVGAITQYLYRHIAEPAALTN